MLVFRSEYEEEFDIDPTNHLASSAGPMCAHQH